MMRPGTEIIAGEGKIITAGGIDTHVHFICPQQIEEALFSGPNHIDRRGHRPGGRDDSDDLFAGTLAYSADAWRLPMRFL